MKAGPYFVRVHAARQALSRAMLALARAEASADGEAAARILLTVRHELTLAQAQLRVLPCGEPVE